MAMFNSTNHNHPPPWPLSILYLMLASLQRSKSLNRQWVDKGARALLG
jgi:hypothetical protein